ncbi:hypothetical protein LTR62_004319 [Meristemomyces frigidus]|uniref:Mediator of RNA polymerase II transcription subunit 21 n=1 Tax=Meristemomyces frigidus TaxID=1508187 RepID=A0AAN7THQ1_9PEZI|nr:hypothetical protein LTR62_004319 [Meristemomyces frigidus]
MADRLTQLQDALDNQMTLMYATINYIKTRHPYADIPGQPSQAPEPVALPVINGTTSQPTSNGHSSQPNGPARGTEAAPTNDEQATRTGSPRPEQPSTFNAALHELARDLVLQEQQIEILINSLPGLGSSEESQTRRMRELEAELRVVEEERLQAEKKREAMIKRLGDVLTRTQRVT